MRGLSLSPVHHVRKGGALLYNGRHSAICRVAVLAFAFMLPSCASETGQRDEQQVFKLGRDDQVHVSIASINKGLGSTEESLNVVFTIDELKKLFNTDVLPLPPKAMKTFLDPSCKSGLEFSLRLEGGLDHTSRQWIEARRNDAHFKYETSPRTIFGLLDYGPISYDRTRFGLSNILMLANRDKHFGFRVECGFLNITATGGCTVYRDFSKTVYAQYHYCEALLPYWRELDDLYFTVATRIVREPTISLSYRLSDTDVLSQQQRTISD